MHCPQTQQNLTNVHDFLLIFVLLASDGNARLSDDILTLKYDLSIKRLPNSASCNHQQTNKKEMGKKGEKSNLYLSSYLEYEVFIMTFSAPNKKRAMEKCYNVSRVCNEREKVAIP